MMTPFQLPESEKENLTHWLSKRANAGGWFMLGMAGLMLLLIVLALANRSRTGQRPFTTDDFIPLIVLLMAFILPGIWLLRRRHAIRRLFNKPLFIQNGRILNKYPTPYSGLRILVEVQHFDGKAEQATITYIGQPDWQVGNSIELILWEDGRFCPRHMNHLTDFSHLPNSPRRRLITRRIVIGVILWLLLSLMGILLGLYGQGRL